MNSTFPIFRNRQRKVRGVPALLLVATILAICVSVSCAQESPSRFRIEIPRVNLRGVPVPQVQIVALRPDGNIDTGFQSPVDVSGLRVIDRGEKVTSTDFERGVLTLATNPAYGRQVFIISEEISVTSGGETTRQEVHSRPGWVSLIPPLLAIVFAVWWQEVTGALFLAICAGMLLISSNPVYGLLGTIDPLLLSMLTNRSHAEIIFFTMFLGAMVGIMSGSGGTHALVTGLTKHVTTRRHGQFATWIMGMLIFFDDYANTLLIGGSMRPVLDRLKVSREKLAFLIDSTAAPVAGLALVSTWVGVEFGYMQSAYESVGLPVDDIYQTFVATIPYRFYPILILAFVGVVAATSRDFGPMLRAEETAWDSPPHSTDSPLAKTEEDEVSPIRHAILPLAVLCAALGVGLYLDSENSTRALLLASSVAVVTAVASVVFSRKHSLAKTIAFGMEGMQQMLPAVVVLLFAWSVAEVCNREHLNTAGYLVHQLGGQLSPRWMPAITFLLAAIVSFATGTSYGTMGLLIPLSVAVEFQLLQEMSLELGAIAHHPWMLATVGAVLGGAIFGDHCSPISDTTILSSAAAGCDHFAHVRTQMPYAMMTAIVALGAGYVPVAMDWPPLFSMPAAILLLFVIMYLLGRNPEIPREEKPVPRSKSKSEAAAKK
ncbi:MAG: hypothetical protein KDA80_16510 [Planctomycetaceae bacterium]|nr:hypothetical protein [Planctomycetaceae bacterium]